MENETAPRFGPPFDQPVPRGGYLWWYVDGLSDDGRHGLTLIAFIGSVFSPYYAWSGWGDPLNHCSVNLALYGASDRRWVMTERGRDAVFRSANQLVIGPSSLVWRDGALEIKIDELAAPLPRRVRGTIRLTPGGLPSTRYPLTPDGRHLWQPVAPLSRLSLRLDHPGLAWDGDAYHDSNFGAEPLESGFQTWTWSRAHLAERTAVLYDALRRDGGKTELALGFSGDGAIEALTPPPEAPLPRTLWRVKRHTRADAGASPHQRMAMEDAPFYSRSVVSTTLYGESVDAVHESLDLDRFANPLLRCLLPFRMPRAIF